MRYSKMQKMINSLDKEVVSRVERFLEGSCFQMLRNRWVDSLTTCRDMLDPRAEPETSDYSGSYRRSGSGCSDVNDAVIVRGSSRARKVAFLVSVRCRRLYRDGSDVKPGSESHCVIYRRARKNSRWLTHSHARHGRHRTTRASRSAIHT